MTLDHYDQWVDRQRLPNFAIGQSREETHDRLMRAIQSALQGEECSYQNLLFVIGKSVGYIDLWDLMPGDNWRATLIQWSMKTR